MDPWFNQMGFPLLTVTNSGDGTAQVTSQRFFNPVDQSPDTPSYFK
jgi:aminopeptidase N